LATGIDTLLNRKMHMTTDKTDISNAKERDLSLFPQDESGEQLWRLASQGLDLSLAYEIEFSMIFPTEKQALTFGHLLLANNQKLSFSPYQASDTHPWEITAYPIMDLTHQNIIGYQQLLTDNAKKFLGVFDGWFISDSPEQ
jgi:hypothetical protein